MSEKNWKPTDGDFEKIVESEETMAIAKIHTQHDINKRVVNAIHALFAGKPEPDNFVELHKSFKAVNSLSTEAKKARTDEDRRNKSLDFEKAIADSQTELKTEDK